jgi:hypothetical protein
MDDELNQPAHRWMPWWCVLTAMGLSVLAATAMFAAIILEGFVLLICWEILRGGGPAGIGVVVALWGVYVLCLALFCAKRHQLVILGAGVALCPLALLIGLVIKVRGFVGPAVLFALASAGLLLIALQAARLAERLVNPDRWARYRLARGLCPVCGYDIRGLPHCRCPECGTMWSAEEMGDEVGESARAPRLP